MTNVRKSKVERITRDLNSLKENLITDNATNRTDFVLGKIEAFSHAVDVLQKEFNFSVNDAEKLPPGKKSVIIALEVLNTPESLDAAKQVREWRSSSNTHGGWDTWFVTQYPEYSYLIETIPIQNRI